MPNPGPPKPGPLSSGQSSRPLGLSAQSACPWCGSSDGPIRATAAQASATAGHEHTRERPCTPPQGSGSLPGSPPSLLHPPSGCRFHTRCEYVMNVCRTTVPELLPSPHEPGHLDACHLDEETKGREAAKPGPGLGAPGALDRQARRPSVALCRAPRPALPGAARVSDHLAGLGLCAVVALP